MTHLHEDHFALDAIVAISTPATTIVGPAEIRKHVPRALAMANGQRRTVADVLVEAVPMYNVQRGPGLRRPASRSFR